MAQTTRRPTTRVIEALAERADVDRADLRPPLASAVDPDALDALVESANGDSVAVRFEYGDHEVLVRGNGHVSVE